MSDTPWPSGELDPIRRVRVLEAALPGAAVAERVLDAPYDAVWAVATDFEGGIPAFEPFVGGARIESRDGERLAVRVRSPVGFWQRNHVILRPGWCWMESRFFVVAMVARPEGERTRFAHLEGSRVRGARVFKPLLRWKMPAELDRIERLAQERA